MESMAAGDDEIRAELLEYLEFQRSSVRDTATTRFPPSA
jgi:hypothetical protein